MPTFSIIIPTFNAELTLDKALDSIAAQSYTDFEVLIQDGLSTDRTVAIAKDYTEKISQLSIISEADNGIYDGMNKALKRATGEYIYFMGGDDAFYNSDVLKEIGHELLENPVDVIYGDVFSSRFGGRYDGSFLPEKIVMRNICHQAIFVHHKVFKSLGNFKNLFKAHADWDHNISWMLHKKIKNRYVNLVIATYADGGYSSVHGDPEFEILKGWLAFNKGFFQIPDSVLLSVAKGSLKSAVQVGNTSLILRYKLLIIFLKIIKKLKRIF
jgi:glycosyltransferase involved in cell wall biosynthesis